MSKLRSNLLFTIIVFAFLVCIVVSCKDGIIKKMSIPNEAMELANMESKGEISQDEEIKQALLNFFKNDYKSRWHDLGYDYRIDELIENWKAYKDGDHQILMGTVCQNKDQCDVFIEVYFRGKTVYFKFKEFEMGEYPNIIPNLE